MPEHSDESPRLLTNHALPFEHFDALARGEGGPETVRLLQAGEHSRRLLILRALLDLATERPELLGSLPPADAAWDAFIAVHDHAPDALRRVLLHPQVGTWISHCLRLARAGGAGTSPTWAEVGQVHAVALAAAVRAGLPLDTRLPVRHGCILLPTLGLARFPSVDGYLVADAHSADGICHLRVGDRETKVLPMGAADTATWWGLRTVRCESGRQTLTVSLDDIDLYRNLADPVEPSRLDDRTARTWQGLLDGAWAVLTDQHPAIAEAMAAGLTSIAPLADDQSWVVRSASTGDGFGGALISLPRDPVTLAVTMVHEFQHIKLGGLLHLATLYRDDDREHLYAPWRPDPRPLAGLLQGVYAFFGITEFWRTQRAEGSDTDRRVADFEFAYARQQTWTALRTVSRSPHLTDLGARFVGGLERRLRPWLAESVPEDLERAAWAAVRDHRAGWRIRNFRADPAWVAESAAAWEERRDRPPSAADPEVQHDRRAWTHGRLTLYRIFLRAPDRFGHERTLPPGATSADVALVAGEPAAAAEQYLAWIAADPTYLDAWTGLGLALAALGDTPTWRALLNRPQLVYALYLELVRRRAQPSPIDVSRWVAGLPFCACRPNGQL